MTDGAIWISSISGENPRPAVQTQPGSGIETQPRFSPDGRKIAFALRNASGGPYGELAVADLDSVKLRLLTHDHALVLSPAWSADGNSIYFASSRGGTINIWKIAATGGEPAQITAGEGDDVDLDVSNDGKQIVFGTLRRKVGISRLDLQAKAGEPSVKVLTTDPARNQIMPAYSPDGEHLAFMTNLKGVEREEIWVSDVNGSNAVPLVQDQRKNIFPAWTPDSKYIIYQSIAVGEKNELFRRVPISGGVPQTLTEAGVRPPHVGRDGRVLFLGAKRTVEAFDPRTGKTQALGTLPANALPRICWSPDENSVAYLIGPSKADDPNAGLWVDDFKNPPRQIFRGWVIFFALRPGNKIYFLEGKPDLNADLWRVDWNGQDLVRTRWNVRGLYNFTYRHNIVSPFDVSPDGRYLAFDTEQVLEKNIGMLENVR
jgi:Tol biopolymer transport system component